MENYAICVKNVSKEFQEETALENVNVNFERGKIHGLVGRNGSGKTVLLKCICGFLQPTSGEIIVNGEQVGKDVDFPTDMGVIIETPGFLPYCSGLKNLEMLAKIRSKLQKNDLQQIMIHVGLNPRIKKGVGKYSLGMRQRLGIAQAIMENPSLLVLDEPMNGLDRQGVEDVRKVLLALKEEGKTILIASHSAEDISILCDTVCEMEHGKLTKTQ